MKAFLFDVDDTLYDQLQPFQRAYLKMFGEPEGVDLERLFSQSRKRGDEVFEASQLGTISMEEIAAAAGSFNYEFACGISRRVPRVYLRGGKAVHTVHYLTDIFQEEPHGT